MIASGDNGRHDHCVDEATRYPAAGLLENDSKRARMSIPVGEVGVCVWDVEADNQHPQYIED